MKKEIGDRLVDELSDYFNQKEIDEINSLVGIELLEYLDKTNKFVYHGSPNEDISELEPRQQKILDKKTKKMIHDGEPAVCATDIPKISTFRAITASFKGENDYFSAFSIKNGREHYRVSEKIANGVKNREGYVYVLDKRDFKKERVEWRSSKTVKPIMIVKVTHEDLPNNIEIIDRKTFFGD